MSIAWVPSHRQWLAIRCSSARIVRMYRARRGTSSDISFSTVSQYPRLLLAAAT